MVMQNPKIRLAANILSIISQNSVTKIVLRDNFRSKKKYMLCVHVHVHICVHELEEL